MTGFMENTCKQGLKAAHTKAFCPVDATFVPDHNHLPHSAAEKTHRNMIYFVIHRHFC